MVQVFGVASPLRLGYHMFGPVAGLMALLGFLLFLFYPECGGREEAGAEDGRGPRSENVYHSR